MWNWKIIPDLICFLLPEWQLKGLLYSRSFCLFALRFFDTPNGLFMIFSNFHQCKLFHEEQKFSAEKWWSRTLLYVPVKYSLLLLNWPCITSFSNNNHLLFKNSICILCNSFCKATTYLVSNTILSFCYWLILIKQTIWIWFTSQNG